MKNKQDNDMTDQTGAVNAENETKLSWPTNWVWFVTKTRQDNDIIDRRGVVYAENETMFSWRIKSGVDCNEN